MIGDNIAIVNEKIAKACQKAGKDPSEIILVGVTKYSRIDQIREGIESGLVHIGENKVRDAAQKFEELGESVKNVTKHMIGHLQTNKVKAALQVFDIIQTLDSVKLANEIEKQAEKIGRDIDVFIEVNSGEDQKAGIAKDGVFDLIEHIAEMQHINVLGLMTMAPYTDDESVIRNCFSSLRELKNNISGKYAGLKKINMKYLSMGMTGDFEIAIEEGANMIRIGSAIFSHY